MTDRWLLNLENRVSAVGLDTCPALLALKVLINRTKIYQRLSVIMRRVIFKVPVSHLTKYLVGHVKKTVQDVKIYTFYYMYFDYYVGSIIRPIFGFLVLVLRLLPAKSK